MTDNIDTPKDVPFKDVPFKDVPFKDVPFKDVPFKKATPVAVDRLQLDRQNPRLVGLAAPAHGEKISDEKIIAQLYRSEELDELLQSIAANGYLDIEPLIVMTSPDARALIVLEGNRRLAGLRLFREPELAGRIAATEKLRIGVPSIDETRRSSLDKVSVYRVHDREAARAFIGFKHINGAAKWESYAKAKFAADWYRTGNVTLADIAESIGDRHDTIRRMVTAIHVLDQAAGKRIFDIGNRNTRRFNFSHLYTALARKQYMDYLGLESAWARSDPEPNPVPADCLERLGEVLVWIFGSREDDKLPVIQSPNPDIRRLGEVLASPEGVHVLKTTANLDAAHSSTRPAAAKLSAALVRSRQTLQEASSNLRGYDGKDRSLPDIADDIRETANLVYDRMKKKNREAMGADK